MDKRVKGKGSPEYIAIRRHYGDLAAVLQLPVNSESAATQLFEVELINSPTIPAGRAMVDSVLLYVEFDATKFNQFLDILHNLSSTDEIVQKLRQELQVGSINCDV